MSELASAASLLTAKLPLYLFQYPTGRWGWVGSIPLILCRVNEKKNFCGADYISKIYETKDEAIQDANNNGVAFLE